MATASGSIGSAGSMTYFTNPVYTGINLSSGYYPNGTITLTGVGGGAYWVNNHINYKKTMKLYLCDSNGNNKKLLFTIEMPGGSATSSYKTSSVKATALEGKKLYLIGEGDSDYIFLRNATGITVTTAKSTFTITCWESTHGYVTASKSSAQAGDTITLTAHPDTGYELTGWDVTSGVTISGSKFTMPSKNVDVTGIFTKKNYTITKKANPSGAGTVTVSISGTSVSAANYGDILTLSQTPAAGSVFTGWTISPNLTITSNAITMPASAITVTANYKRRSTASFGKTTLTGGETALLTISSESTSYTHKYKLSFGTNMETSMTDVAAGVSSVSVEIPESWSNYIPNAATKSGTLTLETYSGTTLIGTYTLSLTYAVPASAVPEIAVPTLTVVRTIDGVTFGNIGDIYAQNHCGVRIQATASGALSSTITGMTITLPGYSGGGSSGSGSIAF